MTVAAVVLAPEPDAALNPIEGEPALRRVVHAAWSGGALPIVLVTPARGLVAELQEAAAEIEVTFLQPDAQRPRGIAWFELGMRSAQADVAATSAALLWPVPRVWIDPETVTSLIEAHGSSPDTILRPRYAGTPGFPILLPLSLLERLAAKSGMHGEEAVAALVAEGAPLREIELGDPGIVHDMATPRAALPPYQGPPEPPAGPPPEWNQSLAEAAEPRS